MQAAILINTEESVYFVAIIPFFNLLNFNV